MKCPKCGTPDAKKLKPMNIRFMAQRMGENVPTNYLEINEPVACPHCGLLLLFGESFSVPDSVVVA
jgi:DNA-directed RNA polymerase subunit RPC12/RpoP